jgi:hypothetical protein
MVPAPRRATAPCPKSPDATPSEAEEQEGRRKLAKYLEQRDAQEVLRAMDQKEDAGSEDELSQEETRADPSRALQGLVGPGRVKGEGRRVRGTQCYKLSLRLSASGAAPTLFPR